MKIDLIMFLQDKVLPRRLQLSFYRIRKVTAKEDLTKCFNAANKIYNHISIDDHYNEKHTKTHLSARVYFNTIPTTMELLSIKPYSYYTLNQPDVNLEPLRVTNNCMQESIINPVQIIVNNAFEKDGYIADDIIFQTYNNDETQ